MHAHTIRWIRLIATSVAMSLTLAAHADSHQGKGRDQAPGQQQENPGKGPGNGQGKGPGHGKGKGKGGKNGQDEQAAGRTFKIEPGQDAASEAVFAFVSALPGDVIEFGCGWFEMDTALVMQNTEGVLIKGCGINETVISFDRSDAAEGIFVHNSRGITIEDLTIVDMPGDGFKLKGVDHGTLRRVRAMWSSADTRISADNWQDEIIVECPVGYELDPPYKVSPETGRYGIYPVQSSNILIEASESVGASDAGIYVGQTNKAIIRGSRAAYNVMAYEIENVKGGEYDSNIAECNTAGFLVYDLDYLNQYGYHTRVYNNIIRRNNTENFTALGGFIAAVPQGTGLILLAYDQIEVFDNTIEDHNSASIIIASYELLGGTGDRKLDGYAEGLHIHDNVMRNAGSNPPPPNMERVILQGDISTALPTLLRLKNGGFGAHIVWDGLLDDVDRACPYPTDASGEPIAQDPHGPKGKPDFRDDDPNPDCHYNAYKFDEQDQRIMPDWWMCIDSNNTFQQDNPLIPDYVNFHGLEGLEVVIAAADQNPDPAVIEAQMSGLPRFVPDRDMSPHDCVERFGKTLEPLAPVILDEYTPSGNIDPAPSDEEIAQVCGANVSPGQINRAALGYNCPQLDQYNLFADAQDPRSAPNEGGLPFVLNAKLFSDYSTKYRVAFIPPGQQAVWKDLGNGGVNASIEFPVGTVIAKTFAFPNETIDSEEVIETRLLIKRVNRSGQEVWVGLPYLWETAADGSRVAHLALKGATRAVSWNYTDPVTGKQLVGATDAYSVPHFNQCITCHGNDDRPTGSAPIGPKVRFLNRGYAPESGYAATHTAQGQMQMGNQLDHWRQAGVLQGGPATLEIDNRQVASNTDHNPRYNVPGDAGHAAGSAADIEARARSYLEVNCQHCHNQRGVASNSGLFLDIQRAVNEKYGICKTPTAAGGGTGGNLYDIVPADADASILPFRLGANDAESQMPPIARSVTHEEGLALITEWVNNVVDGSYDNADQCNTAGLPSAP